MKFLGRLAFAISLPFWRWYLKRTSRAYVLLTDGDKILVVKNWLSRQKWQLPGGGIRRSESAAQAVVRELQEEVGLSVSLDSLQQTITGVWRTDGLGFDYGIYTGQMKEQPLKIRRPEIVEAAWLDKDQLTPDNTVAEVLNAVGHRGF